jgi:hypothetical protein
MLFLQDKNQLTVSGRSDGGEPWADAASARSLPGNTEQYVYDAPPPCPFEPPGTMTEMAMGYRKLRMSGNEGNVVNFEYDQPEMLVPRNNYSRRSV